MFRKIRNYYTYRNIIKQNLPTLTSRYNLKFDPMYGRLWTVFNLPPENHETVQKYGYRYLDDQVKKYINSLQTYFWNIGLGELISIRKTDMIDSINVLIVFRYKYHKHQMFLYVSLALLIVIGGGVLLGGVLKLILFLIALIF
jgi:hypothetical protein